MKGKFIVIYGINNLGKTTQAKLLTERIRNSLKDNQAVQHIKYPIYDLVPTGLAVNDYLRKGNPHKLSPETFQVLNVLNRLQFQPQLQAMLNEENISETSTTIVAEDYWGTGLAWGIGAGVNKEFLLSLNTVLLKEDIAFLIDGERFHSGVEKEHIHETNDSLTENVRLIFQGLAKEFGWHVINANQTVEDVHEEIWKKVKEMI